MGFFPPRSRSGLVQKRNAGFSPSLKLRQFGSTQSASANFSAGFTLIELLVVFAIVAVLVLLAIFAFRYFQEERALTGATEGVLSTIAQARWRTLASKNQTVAGVHIEAGSYVLFQGVNYVAGAATNETFLLPPEVEFNGWNLGGGDELIFDRLTGKTSQAGTIQFRLKNRPARTKTITILGTGIASSD